MSGMLYLVQCNEATVVDKSLSLHSLLIIFSYIRHRRFGDWETICIILHAYEIFIANMQNRDNYPVITKYTARVVAERQRKCTSGCGVQMAFLTTFARGLCCGSTRTVRRRLDRYCSQRSMRLSGIQTTPAHSNRHPATTNDVEYD